MKNFIKILIVLIATSISLYPKKMIVINLTQQEAYAYENGKLIMKGEVSTGKPGHRTPTGTFRILQKKLRHKSSKYPEPTGGARMDYMMRLTSSGIAMHLGYVPNYPASHGCIRLKNGFAQRLFSWASVGTKVSIEGTPPVRISRRRGKVSTKSSSRVSSVRRISDYELDSLYVPNSPELVQSRKRRGVYQARGRRYHRHRAGAYGTYTDRTYRGVDRRDVVYRDSSRRGAEYRTKYRYGYSTHRGKRYKKRVIHLDDLSYSDYVADPYIRGVKVRERY
jgi:hypothetical protein